MSHLVKVVPLLIKESPATRQPVSEHVALGGFKTPRMQAVLLNMRYKSGPQCAATLRIQNVRCGASSLGDISCGRDRGLVGVEGIIAQFGTSATRRP
jgi:hypothetical protein